MMKKSVFLVLLILLFQELNAQRVSSAEPKRPSVGLVLSGGGAKGFAYIGLLKVFHEVGLQVDYIGGSSIGSIIGGLYAIGYHPDSIAKMIRRQKWDDLLKDITDRRYLPFEEKEYGENTLVRLPIKGKKISLSTSMYQGQEINLLLNYYFSPAYKINDFHKFQTPFLCIGTDLLTGEQVVLDKGCLPMAIRASMSIPGYFSPTEYQGKYLVDGGVVNNYPVKEVKEMGARIIIGGDVQSGLHSSREELNSITAVLDQITSFPRVEANRIGDSLTDLKIRYPMPNGMGMMDFENYDSIIAFGEKVARQHYAAIKSLADSLNAIEFRPMKKYTARPLDSLFIDSIIIRGNKKIPDSYFKSLFPSTARIYISLKYLHHMIRLMQGSGFFENTSYELEYKNRKTSLIINVTEGGPGALAAGIHFDSDYGVGIILSGNFNNLLIPNSNLYVSLNLSINPRFRAAYLAGLGGKAGIGLKTDIYNFTSGLYEKDIKINKISFTNYKGSLFFYYTLRKMVNLKAGLDYEYFRFQQDVMTDSSLRAFDNFSSYGTVFLSLSADSRDKPSYPRKGVLAKIRGEYVIPLSKNWSSDLFSNATILYIKYDHFFPLSKRFVLQPGLFAGSIFWDKKNPPLQHLLGLGGLAPRNYFDQVVPFTGLHFIQKYGQYSAVVRMKLEYNVYKKLYLTLRADAGAAEHKFEQLFNSGNFLLGYGVTAGYDSFIGPVELTLQGSNINPGVMLFVNIGFPF